MIRPIIACVFGIVNIHSEIIFFEGEKCMWHEYIIDKNEKTVRGSFVNMTITISILSCTVYGLLFSDVVAARLEKLTTFIIGFFTSSYGLWSLKKHMDDRLDTQQAIEQIRANVPTSTVVTPPVAPKVTG